MSDSPASARRRRYLIVRLSSIGDVAHALPALVALREADPDAFIGWAVEEAAAPMVRALDAVDAVHLLPIQTWRRSFASPPTWRAIRTSVGELRRTRYDIALDLQGLWKSAVVARLSGARVFGLAPDDLRESGAAWLHHDSAPPGRPDEHVTQRGLRLVARATGTAPAEAQWPRLADDASRERVRQHLTRSGAEAPILLHAVANWASKAYPEDRWVHVGRELHARTGRTVLWLWGPGERERAERLASTAGAGNQASFPVELPELAALCEAAAVMVGGDSAPLHIAVACATPVVALFGPTAPDRLGPQDPADEILVRQLECSHCHRRVCPLGTNECLESIGPDEIVAAAITRLAAARPHPTFTTDS